MSLLKVAKSAIRIPLNAMGLDVVRRPSKGVEQASEAEKTGNRADPRLVWLTRLDIRTVIDVGAHQGEFARMIHGILPEASILSFEPLEDCYRQLRFNMRDVARFTAFNCAVGDARARVVMHRNEYSPSSSLLKMAALHKTAFPFTVRESEEMIEVRRLDDALRDMRLEDHVLVKIDVQGYEDRVIAGGEELLCRARVVIAETSFSALYEGQPLFDDIYRELTHKGFRYTGNFEQLLNPEDGSVLQADAVFQRT
jgi:FkbM family methyltransferase